MAKEDKNKPQNNGKSDLEQKEQERLKKKAEIEKKIKESEKKERKRIDKLIKFPFKTLFQISILGGLLYFTVLFFGNEYPFEKALYNSSLVFIAILLGVGIIMTAVVLVVADKKSKEAKLEAEQAKEAIRLENEKKQQELKNMEEEIRINEKQLRNNFNSTLTPEIEDNTAIPLPDSYDTNDAILIDENQTLNENDALIENEKEV